MENAFQCFMLVCSKEHNYENFTCKPPCQMLILTESFQIKYVEYDAMAKRRQQLHEFCAFNFLHEFCAFIEVRLRILTNL